MKGMVLNMTLNEFINHLKHNSININVFEDGKIWYLGSVGSYKTSIVKSKIGNFRIEKIEPLELDENMNIFIEGK